MTKKALQIKITVVVFALLALLVGAAFFKFSMRSDTYYNFLKDFSSVFIAIAAAYLAYCFQQRMVFVNSLRDLWKEIVKTKNALINFTYKKEPSELDYAETQQMLYNTIDAVRSVYRNVGESARQIGYYPFEPLHDMRRAFERCVPGQTSDEARRQARVELVRAWHSLKWAFLRELPTPQPSSPLVNPGSTDPRR